MSEPQPTSSPDDTAEPTPDAQRRDGIEHGRMRVKDVRPDLPGDGRQPFLKLPHQLELAENGPIRRSPFQCRGSVKMPAVDLLFFRCTANLFG